MLVLQLPLAACKPALRRQEYKTQYQHAEDVPLPGISGVFPKEDPLDQAQQSPPCAWLVKLMAIRRPDARMAAASVACLASPVNNLIYIWTAAVGSTM